MEDEHPAVPAEVLGLQVRLGGPRSGFSTNRDAEAAVTVDRLALFDVAEAGRRMGGVIAKVEGVGDLLHQRNPASSRSAKTACGSMRWSAVRRRSPGSIRASTAAVRPTALRVSRPQAEDAVVVDGGDRGSNLVPESFTAQIQRRSASTTLQDDRWPPEEAAAADQGNELLGAFGPTHRPEPGAGSTGHDHALHGETLPDAGPSPPTP